MLSSAPKERTKKQRKRKEQEKPEPRIPVTSHPFRSSVRSENDSFSPAASGLATFPITVHSGEGKNEEAKKGSLEVQEAAGWRIKTPTQIHLYGSSMSGKSQIILKILRNCGDLFDYDFKQVIYCSPLALEKEDVEYIDDLRKICRETGKVLVLLGKVPTLREISGAFPTHPVLLVLDDTLCLENLEELNKLSSLICHHRKASLVMALQNAFQKSNKTDFTSVARNCTGKFILWQTSDMRYVTQLNTTMFPERKHFILDCMRAAKSMGLNYIYLDTHPFSSLDRRFIAMTALFKDGENKDKEPVCFDLHD